MAGQSFHITVGASPLYTGTVSLEHDLRLLKAAILYADQVMFCSPTSSILSSLLRLDELGEEEWLDLFVFLNNQVFNNFVEDYKRLSAKKYRNKQEMLIFRKSKAEIKNARREGEIYFRNLAREAGVDHLKEVLSTGLVELQIFSGTDIETITYEFFNTVSGAVLSGETYPLFDNPTGKLVQAAVKEGIIEPPQVSINRAKQVGLSSDLLQRLPLFDAASVDEVVDIRKELDNPLIRFRSAIIEYSADIQSGVWDKDFPIESEQVFRQYIEPAILDIEEACRSNNFLSSFLPNLVNKPIVPSVTSALGLLLAQSSQMPELIGTGLGLAAGTAAVALQSFKERQETKQKVESNQLYFYYKVGKSLEN